MGDQGLIPGTDDPRFDEERLRERECDMTPRPVVEQLFELLRVCPHFDKRPPRSFLDPAAGAGVFAAVARQAWPDAKVITVEPAPEEYEGLNRAAAPGLHSMCTFQEYAPRCHLRFDIIGTNPPFSQAREFVERARPLLADDGLLVLLLRSSWCQRGEEAISWLLEAFEDGDETVFPNIPEEVIDVSGPISFRAGAASFDSYSWWIWGREPRRLPRGAMPRWEHSQLPMLPGWARRWTVRPGEET